MQEPAIVVSCASKLDILSEKAATLSQDSPKLGKLAGFGVAILKTSAIIPAILLDTITHLGTLIINTFGAIFSKKCRNDLIWNLNDVGRCLLLTAMSPVLTAKHLFISTIGVITSPDAKREMCVDMLF